MQKSILFLFIAAVLFASCSEDYKKTKSGLIYKIYSDNKSPLVKKGEIIKLHFRQKVRDSVLQETYGGVPGYAMIDSVGPVYNAAELFPLLRKGDSLVVILLGDSVNKKFGLPPYMKKEDKLTLTFKVLDVFAGPEVATTDRTNELNKQKDRQVQAFAKFVAGKGNLQKTPLGTYYEITTPGDGPKVDSGKLVSVRYTGKLIPSGTVFETNMTNATTPPIEFVIGQGSVIRGWDEGLTFFRKGGKGTLYVPADLAYGDGPGPGGQSYQPLMFDIEIVDVKDAPAQPQQQPFIPERMPQGDTSGRR